MGESWSELRSVRRELEEALAKICAFEKATRAMVFFGDHAASCQRVRTIDRDHGWPPQCICGLDALRALVAKDVDE